MTGRLFLLFLFLIASGHVQASICRGQLSQKSPQKAHQIKKGEDSRSFALMKAALRSISHLDALGRQHLKDRFIQNILKSGHEDLLRSYRGILINHDKELDTPLFEKFFFPRGIE
ncbi:MAG: hypothetical protein KDD35_11900, partial [Bdellovibrionales bacterium]|nr:hypothetical protein [Bdellovibrionales bacterium]